MIVPASRILTRQLRMRDSNVSRSAVMLTSAANSPRMLCEVVLSSLWFLFVIFWVETISVWMFLSMFYLDRAFYHWGDGVFADDPGHMIYMLSRVDNHIQTEMQT